MTVAQTASDKSTSAAEPRADLDFPGLKPGDRWCLCVGRWREALQAGVAPPVLLAATHEKALEVVTLEQLQAHASRD